LKHARKKIESRYPAEAFFAL